MAFQLDNELVCIKHCWSIYEHNSIVNSVGVDDWKVKLVIITCNRQKETDTDTTTSLNLLDQGSHSCFNVIIKRHLLLKISFEISNSTEFRVQLSNSVPTKSFLRHHKHRMLCDIAVVTGFIQVCTGFSESEFTP